MFCSLQTEVKNAQVTVKNVQVSMQEAGFFLDVRRGNAKPRALALFECFITRRKMQIGERRGTEGG